MVGDVEEGSPGCDCERCRELAECEKAFVLVSKSYRLWWKRVNFNEVLAQWIMKMLHLTTRLFNCYEIKNFVETEFEK